jgi:hypothetical protein
MKCCFRYDYGMIKGSNDERPLRYEYVMLIMKWLWNDMEMGIWCDDEWVVRMMMIESMCMEIENVKWRPLGCVSFGIVNWKQKIWSKNRQSKQRPSGCVPFGKAMKTTGLRPLWHNEMKVKEEI